MKKDWEIKILKDICRVINGRAYSEDEFFKTGKYKVLRVGNFFTNNTWYYSNLELDEDKYCVEGDLLYAWSASFGPKIWHGEKVIYHYHIWKLETNPCLDKTFFYWWLQSSNMISQFSSDLHGATMHHITKNLMESLSVPVPPLEEQKRIVKILDEKFAQLETIKTNAQTNLQNAKDLFQSQLTKAFSNTTWEKKRLGNVCKIIGGGTPSKKNKNFYEGEIPWASVRDMSQDILSSTEFCITEEAVKSSSTNIIPAGNIIIATRVGLGKVCILNQNTAINQDLKGIIPINENKLDKTYLFWYFKSISDFIISNGVGATVHGVKLDFVQSLEIPLPPLPEQKRIVKELDTLREKVRQLQEIYTKQIADCDELKQSFLQKAFEGEL